jgi:uncharacterized protein (TIGR02246 family)
MRHGELVVGVVCLLAGCSAHEAPDTRAADVKAIEAIEAAWVKAIGSKDIEQWVSYYADDATILLPNAPPVNGKDNIRASLKPRLSDPNFSLTFRPAKIEASTDLAYVQGAYASTRTDPKTKAAVTDQGKYVTVYKKQRDGAWKAIQDMVSSDMPRPIENYKF